MTGHLHDLVFSLLTFNFRYMSDVSLGDAWIAVAGFFGWATLRDPITFLAAAGALIVAFSRAAINRTPSWTPSILGALAVGSFAGVFLGRSMYPHYYLQMALPYALVIGAAVARLDLDRSRSHAVVTVLLGIGIVFAFFPHRPDPAARSADPTQDDTLRQVAQYIEDHADRDDTLFVLGGQPILYYLTGRSAPTPFFFWRFHSDRWDHWLHSRRVTLSAFASESPEWFVYATNPYRVPELERFMRANYRPVASIRDYRIARRVRE
jgi:hypothetical protein